MIDIVKLLPDSVANQIAAGEVIQRPASVVKELVENALDAGSTEIKIIVKDAGKTLIQVVDNGCGMTDTDARMAFERHATSKIREAGDLFAIRTMGFRGEALASIAAVAQVELKTRQKDSELGSSIRIAGSEVEAQEAVSCSVGCNFIIKNLFYNIPARRKFLKTNTTELKQIINELQRIALVNEEVAFMLMHNDQEVYNLPAGNLRQRISSIFGKNMHTRLVHIESETSLGIIKGFIIKPEFARKRSSEQFFFVNGRFMRHPYFHKAVSEGYNRLLADDAMPSYFIYFEVDPATVDINIHPTKTEIKFENEQALWPILMATVKEGIGKFSLAGTIDFDQDGSVEMPVITKDTEISMPTVSFNPEYNPFSTPGATAMKHPDALSHKGEGANKVTKTVIPKSWETLYEDFESDKSQKIEPEGELEMQDSAAQQLEVFESVLSTDENKPATLFGDEESEVAEKSDRFFQLKNRYILTSVRSGLMLVDQQRAHRRILFEKYIGYQDGRRGVTQKILFPETIELNAEDSVILEEILDEVRFLGFDIDPFGKRAFVVNGVPADIAGRPVEGILEQMIEVARSTERNVTDKVKESLAFSLARSISIKYGDSLSDSEMQDIFDRLFACKTPNYDPEGKQTISILEMNELMNRLK